MSVGQSLKYFASIGSCLQESFLRSAMHVLIYGKEISFASCAKNNGEIAAHLYRSVKIAAFSIIDSGLLHFCQFLVL